MTAMHGLEGAVAQQAATAATWHMQYSRCAQTLPQQITMKTCGTAQVSELHVVQ